MFLRCYFYENIVYPTILALVTTSWFVPLSESRICPVFLHVISWMLSVRRAELTYRLHYIGFSECRVVRSKITGALCTWQLVRYKADRIWTSYSIYAARRPKEAISFLTLLSPQFIIKWKYCHRNMFLSYFGLFIIKNARINPRMQR